MITGFYIALSLILYFKLSLEVIKGRRQYQISLGIGDQGEIRSLVAAHDNFAAYTSIYFLALFIAENSFSWPNFVLHILGLGFFLGRLFHFLAFKGKMNFKLRKLGMYLTLWPILLLSIGMVFSFAKNMF